MTKIFLPALGAAMLCLAMGVAAEEKRDEVVLAIQPVLTEAETRRAYQPLADFLGKAIGKRCAIRTRPNFLAYWDTMRKGEYDLVLDGAHFTDYRVRKLGYEILAKLPDTVSYSLVALDSNPILDPVELVAKRVATLGAPSIGAARLNAMFPNPARQPVTIEVESAEVGLQLLLQGKVTAAILPTPIVSQQMSGGGGIMLVSATEPIPHMALSASPRIDKTARDRLRQALLDADGTEEGRRMLKQIGFERFDAATPSVYARHADVLKEYWGF